MSSSEVVDKIKSIIAEQLAVNIDQVVPEASFVKDLGADSLDIVELIMALEEEYDVEIPDEEAEKMLTVEHVISYVVNNKA
jgi:acyl carrier protein